MDADDTFAEDAKPLLGKPTARRCDIHVCAYVRAAEPSMKAAISVGLSRNLFQTFSIPSLTPALSAASEATFVKPSVA